MNLGRLKEVGSGIAITYLFSTGKINYAIRIAMRRHTQLAQCALYLKTQSSVMT